MWNLSFFVKHVSPEFHDSDVVMCTTTTVHYTSDDSSSFYWINVFYVTMS